MNCRSSVVLEKLLDVVSLDDVVKIFNEEPMKIRSDKKIMDWKRCCVLLNIPESLSDKLKQKSKKLGFYERIKELEGAKLEEAKMLRVELEKKQLYEKRCLEIEGAANKIKNASTIKDLDLTVEDDEVENTTKVCEEIQLTNNLNINSDPPQTSSSSSNSPLDTNLDFTGILYNTAYNDKLISLAHKHLYAQKRGLLVNWQAICRELQIGNHEANKIRKIASRLGFVKPSELPRQILESQLTSKSPLEISNNVQLTTDPQLDTINNETNDERAYKQILHFYNLKKNKFDNLKIHRFDLNKKLSVEILNQFQEPLSRALGTVNTYSDKFRMVKSCMLAISSVISFIEKSREKERSKAFNRLKTYSALVKATIKSLQKNKKDRSNKDAARIRKINKRLRLNMGELKSYLIELDMRLTNDVEAKNDTFKLSKIYRQFDNRPSLNTVLPRSSNPVEVPLDIEVAHQFYENLYKKVEEPTSLPIIDEFFEEVSKSFKNLNFEKPSRSDLEEMVVSSANFLTSDPDGIPGKFLVRLNEGKKVLLDFIEEAWNGNLELITNELCEGTTVLLPKTTDSEKLKLPEFYRPITTLNHIYKLLTSTYHRTLLRAIDDSILAPINQKH